MKTIKMTYARKAVLAGGAAIVATALSIGGMGAAAPAFAYQSGGHGHVGLGPRVSNFATQSHGSGGGAGISAFVHSLQHGGSGVS
jgi:hypothetical protein